MKKSMVARLEALDFDALFYPKKKKSLKGIEVGLYLGRARKIRAGILIFLPAARDLSRLDDGKPTR